MSQHDFNIANQGFPAFRADLNNALGALATNSAGSTEPDTTYAYQYWYDETTDLLKMRNGADDAWITLAAFDQTNDEWEIRSAVIQAVDSAGVSIKTDDGTTRVEIADDGSVTVNTSLDVDNIKIDGNSITSTDTNGDINITPDGTGKVVLDGLNYPTADGTDGQVLTTDGSGNIAFEDASGGGITEADHYRHTTDLTADGVFTNWERPDDSAGSATIGSGVSVSSGVFTFPETGYYLVIAFSTAVPIAGDNMGFYISYTANNSSFSNIAAGFPGYRRSNVCISRILDITDTANQKIRFGASSISAGSLFFGDTNEDRTAVTFIRLGDT